MLVGSEDAHLDAPQLQDTGTVPAPLGGPVQWEFALP